MKLRLRQAIKCRLEVIQNDGISQTLEYEGQLPERINAVRQGTIIEGMCHRNDIDDDEAYRKHHGNQEYAKARRDPHNFQNAEFIASLNVPEQGDGGEDPPRVPKESLISREIP